MVTPPKNICEKLNIYTNQDPSA